jgi:dipeptidyl aminopeptidase/acylaminoacyl peptidase
LIPYSYVHFNHEVSMKKRLRFLSCLMLAAAVQPFCISRLTLAQGPMIEPTDNLVAEGIPAIPAEVAEQVRRYTESRAASFVDWHPTKREMLISTRFGNTPQLHYVKMPGGARTQVTFFNEPVGSGSFDPATGNYFVFGKDVGGNEFSQLYRFDLKTGESTLLTDGKRSQNGGPVWNHSKDMFAYGSTQRNGADRDVWIMNPLDPKSNQLLIELSGGGWQIADWSPDNSKIVLLEYLSVNKSNLWMLDVKSKTKSLLTKEEEQVAYGGAEFSHDGAGLYITSDKDNEFQRLAFMDLKTSAVTYLTSDIPWDVAGFEVSPNGKMLGFITNEAGISKAYLMDTSTKKYSAIEGLPIGVIGGSKWHENSRDMAFTINSAKSTSDIYSYDVETEQVLRWTESELGGLVADDLVEPELIRWKSFDDLEITGFLFRASKKFTGKRPVIINIHGGPEGQSQPTFQGRNNYYLNELGVSIIYPNVRGSTGYGKTYVALDNAMKREDSVKDIGALLDWIGTQPDLDASRIMVTGGSYGGYMTLAVATNYNDRIRCSLDVVGISHFGTFLKNTESYRRDLRRVEYGDERDPKIAEFFEKISPLNNASKISKPLFVVQGGNDPRVPLSEAEQMVAKVKENKNPVWYLMAKDEGHGFRKKNNADFQFYATTLFVKKYLIGEK